MKKRITIGILIILVLVSLVHAIRLTRGNTPVIEMEPSKILGRPDAPVYIVIYSDFVCPYCNTIRPVLKSLLDAYPNDLRLLYKHFPLSIHPGAGKAAEASECAGDQGKFWEYHDVLFDNVKGWYGSKDLKSHFLNYASKLNLDEAKFQRCLDSREKKVIVRRNAVEGRKVFVSGTPTCLLNGRKVLLKPNNLNYLKAVIEKELKRGKTGANP